MPAAHGAEYGKQTNEQRKEINANTADATQCAHYPSACTVTLFFRNGASCHSITKVYACWSCRTRGPRCGSVQREEGVRLGTRGLSKRDRHARMVLITSRTTERTHVVQRNGLLDV
jgi:hypothetical protein